MYSTYASEPWPTFLFKDIPGLVIQAWTGQSAKEFAKTGHPS